MMGKLSFLSDNEKITLFVEETLNTLGLSSILFPREPLPAETYPFFHTLVSDLIEASEQKAYTAIVIPLRHVALCCLNSVKGGMPG